MVSRISSDKELFLKAMLEDELGLLQTRFDSPYRAGAVTGLAFAVGAFIPVFPYIFISSHPTALSISAAASLLALLAVGAAKTRYTGKNPLKSALEMALIGVVAGAVSYLAGSLIPGAGI
jgi:predicted membrane protein (TIGR00267 family)